MKYHQLHNILIPNQHGFLKKQSTETQLILAIDDLAKNMDSRKQTDMIILDFSKAFDNVARQKILNKINHYGIEEPLHTWVDIGSRIQHRLW